MTLDSRPSDAVPSTWVRLRYPLLVVALVVGGISALVGRDLALDRSIENMFAPSDPILKPYRHLQRTFGKHEQVIAVYPDPELTTPEGLGRIEHLAAQLRAIPGVVGIVSLLDPPLASDFENQDQGAAFRRVFASYTHSEALDAAGIVCLIERPDTLVEPGASRAATDRRRATLAAIRKAVSAYPGGVVVGEPVLIEEAFDLLEEDGRRLNTWCTLLVLLTLVLSFGSLRWILLPLVVVQVTLATTRAVLVLSGLRLSMVSSMLSAIITVVGVATVVHVIVRYRDGLARGMSRIDALQTTLGQLAMPVAFACFTDAAGFASLMVSQVGPVHDFGLMMAIGSLLVLPCAAATVPALTLLGTGPTPDDLSAQEPQPGWLDRLLAGVLRWSSAHTRPLAAATVALVTLVSLGALRLERETDFTRNFRDDSSLVGAYRYVESSFGGAGVWDLMIPAPARPTRAYLLQTLEMQSQLHEQAPELTKAISLADSLDAGVGGLKRIRMEFAVTGGLSLMRARMAEFVDAIYHVEPDSGQHWLRVMLRAPEQLEAARKSRLIQQVEQTARKTFPEAQVTGYYVLLTRLIESVLADQWKTFGVAAAVVLAMLAIALRSLKMALVAMIPNVVPVLVLFGAMGWLGVRINMGAAMIAAVSVGLSVDGSIHYVMDYRRRRRLGLDRDTALAEVQSTVGRAAVFATLALVVGFATLATSDFVPTIYFGVLVSLSMVGGLVGNLVALPLLLKAIEPASA
jgi:predicted RND superfamily exporter protein